MCCLLAVRLGFLGSLAGFELKLRLLSFFLELLLALTKTFVCFVRPAETITFGKRSCRAQGQDYSEGESLKFHLGYLSTLKEEVHCLAVMGSEYGAAVNGSMRPK